MGSLKNKIERFEDMAERLSAFVYCHKERMILDANELYYLHQEISYLQREIKKMKSMPISELHKDASDWWLKATSKFNQV